MSDDSSRLPEHDTVHVWWFGLDDPRLDPDAAFSTLAEDEQARASRLRRPQDRSRWVVARATLRQILGRYAGIEPCLVRFSYSSDGKPSLADQLGDRAPEFNLSHAGSYAVCSIARGYRVGVDLEVEGAFDHETLVHHRFTPQESALLASLPAGKRSTWFAQLWTYKEAYAKAQGSSLDAALGSVVIRPKGDGTAAILRARHGAQSEPWTLQALPVMPGYCGALAAASADCRVRFEAWPG